MIFLQNLKSKLDIFKSWSILTNFNFRTCFYINECFYNDACFIMTSNLWWRVTYKDRCSVLMIIRYWRLFDIDDCLMLKNECEYVQIFHEWLINLLFNRRISIKTNEIMPNNEMIKRVSFSNRIDFNYNKHDYAWRKSTIIHVLCSSTLTTNKNFNYRENLRFWKIFKFRLTMCRQCNTDTLFWFLHVQWIFIDVQ